jgi:GNAT superfamily N-acetyltransferase
MNQIVETRLPTLSEFKHLRIAVGWPLPIDEIIKRALSNSLFGVCIIPDRHVVGTGRVVGGGAIYFHIQDVMVPELQRSGVGRMIMNALMSYLQQTASRHANVGLMSSKGRETFYENFGFTVRPNDRFGAGMIMLMD